VSFGDRPLDLPRGEPALEEPRDQLHPEDVAEAEGPRLTRFEDSNAHQPLDAVRGDAGLPGKLIRGEGPGHTGVLEADVVATSPRHPAEPSKPRLATEFKRARALESPACLASPSPREPVRDRG
jgi:hypothetical protein